MNFLAKIIAFLFYFLDKRRKKIVFTNLNLVYPNISKEEKKRLVKKIYNNFAYNFLEIIKNRNITKEELSKKVEFEGLDKFEQIQQPVIFITAHYSNWEMMPLILGGVLKIPMSVVVRNLDNKLLNRFFKSNREKFNIETFDKKGALKHLIKALKNKRSVGIFVDQNTAKSDGVDVEMFGLKALQTPVAAILSKKFNIPIIPVFIQRENDKYKMIFKDAILEQDVNVSVQKQSKVIEEMIKERPKEWYWFHRRFKHYYEDKYE
jgi:KDO2-lipid IV(A) lauroyltransferase